MGEPAVGIDLGTSNTVIAVVQDDQAIVIPDAEGRRVHPSVVSFHPNGAVLVGQEAKRRRAIDPANTIFSVKRLIGRTYDSEAVQSAMWYQPYKIVEGANRQPLVVARGREYAVPEISAMVLRHVCGLAEAYIGEKIEKAVITVPANFNDAQREATRVAGRIAGLNVMRIINEPTAAALAYGYDKGLDNQVAIYDFGGGTFDISILQLHDQVFEVISTAGDTCLGGDDIDYRLVRYMIEMLAREHRVDLSDHLPAINRLGAVAERIKCQLSTHASAMVKVQEIAYAEGGVPIHLEFELTVDQLNQLAMELIQRTFLICDEALGLAGTTTTQIDDVILVGGSTKMPLVRRGVREYFNMEPRTDINPDEVVAVGAAIQAATLLNASALDHRGVVLLDVTPRALGIAVVGGYTDVIIERNAQIPVEQTRRFTTSRDNQEIVRIQVCQGEAKHYDENQPLGELVLENLRPAPRGDVQIEVTFEIDTDGVLNVRARDLDTGRRQEARMQILGVADADDVARMVEDHASMSAEMPAPVA